VSAAQAAIVQDHVSEEVEAKYKQMAEELRKPAPQRNYKVESGDLTKTKLFRADPKLLEKKVVAVFSLVTHTRTSARSNPPEYSAALNIRQIDIRMASERGFGAGEGLSKYPDDLVRLISWNDRPLFVTGGYGSDREAVSIANHFQHLLDKCVDANRPADAMIQFLTSADCERDVTRFPYDGGNDNSMGWTHYIYAATPQEAEQRAAAILQLIDGGMSWPMRKYLLAEGRKSLEAARPIFEEVAKLNAAIKAEEEKLAKPSEISPDILSQLKAQKVMVAVELAGLIARVKACDDMLKDPKKLEISTLQSISDMKVKAEIERVGIKEKLDQINAFIGEGDGRQATQDRIGALKAARSPLLRRAQTSERAAITYANLFDLYAPLPLKDNQITISPVEWTN
jgi:hypothetical protein